MKKEDIVDFLPRGTACIIDFYGTEKEAVYIAAGYSGTEPNLIVSHCFMLKRKSKTPDGRSTKYVFPSNPADIFIREVV